MLIKNKTKMTNTIKLYLNNRLKFSKLKIPRKEKFIKSQCILK